MAKIKLVHFELVSLLDESKKLVEFLQKSGVAELENTENENLTKYQTDYIVNQFIKKHNKAVKAYEILEKYCQLKKPFVEAFSDSKEIEYSDYRLISDRADELLDLCAEIISLEEKIGELNSQKAEKEALVSFYGPWISLDIPMASKRTAATSIFIGSFPQELTKEEILSLISSREDYPEDVEIEVVSKQKMLTCAVIMCHQSSGERLLEILRNEGFSLPDKAVPKIPVKAIEDFREDISFLNSEIASTAERLKEYKDDYDDIRYLSDYLMAQADKYLAVENAAATESVFFLKGYMPERNAEEIKFEVERQFTAQMELSEPDYDNPDVPVLIENKSFAAGVESVTDMYSPPSNKDIDPNPVMAFFYYAFFGLMLSDAGYGLLMIIFSVLANKKFKVRGNLKKTADMALYCGISTVFWGAMFGGFFGDLIPTVCRSFLGITEVPSFALWMDPMSNSIELLLYCFLFGIVHLFAGLLVRGFMLLRDKNYLSAFCDTLPVMVFVVGFAVVGAGFFTEIPENIMDVGIKVLAAGAVLIVLTAGRSSKNILGKLGGGLYGLYNAASGYLGDILSYSRLLALSLVTGVIANVINLLGSMMGNILLFIIIFIVGHTVNIAINLIGTYVHTGRLQYVEFFSKFYEGSGRAFTPFKINSKFFTIKEENKYG
ncbi:MAG: V-type ATP synthase subunit I [Clostridia bacterium]|nr:V-type ATP synthase subunit I [Clostridia bacterium]